VAKIQCSSKILAAPSSLNLLQNAEDLNDKRGHLSSVCELHNDLITTISRGEKHFVFLWKFSRVEIFVLNF